MNFKKLLCILFAVITIIAAGCVTAMAADINADAGQGGQLEEAAKNSGCGAQTRASAYHSMRSAAAGSCVRWM